MAKSKKNSGFFAQGAIMGHAMAAAKRRPSTTDATHQCIEAGKRNKLDRAKLVNSQKPMMSMNFLINGK